MTFAHLIAFNIALIVSIVSPGPAFLIAIQTTLGSGRGAGIAVGFGLGIMASIWTMMALLGLETVFQLVPFGYALTKLIGAIYLLYIAWQMWRGARNQVALDTKPARHAFTQGLLINVLNPKSVLFAAAVLVVIFPEHMTTGENIIVVLNHFVIEIVFYTILALAMSSPAIGKRYLKAKIYIDRSAATVLGALGLRLLFNR